jgi:hypothetical protein
LIAGGVPAVIVRKLEKSPKESMGILQSLLRANKRGLTMSQDLIVAKQIAVEPTALYVRLASEVVGKWPSSFEPSDEDLPGGVTQLIEFMFHKVASSFGEVLTRTAFTFLTYALEGVSDSEMCDLLSLSDKVLEEVNQYSTSPRVPSHVWLRLKSAIENLVIEQSGGCLKWYHRQLKETAEKWVSEELRRECHGIMGDYFGGIVEIGVRDERDISRQLLLVGGSGVWTEVLFDGVRVNRRRCEEAGHHLISAGKWAEAEKELCSLAAVCARAKLGLMFQLLGELGQLQKLQEEKREGVKSERVEHYCRWIMRDAHFLTRCPLRIDNCSTQPVISVARHDFDHLKKLVKTCPIASSSCRWWSGTVLGGRKQFGLDLNVMEGHEGPVFGVCFSPTSSTLISCSGDKTIRIWDSFTG